MHARVPPTSPRCAIRIRNWSRHERRATTARFSRNPPPDAGDRPGVHLRLGHGQNQLDCADASDLSRLVHRILDRLQPHGHDDGGHRLADHQRHRHLGHQHPHRLGICYRQFRLVDRYRQRRHAHLRDFVFVESEVAHLHQPFCGSHDAFRGSLRGYVPAHAHRPAVDGVLHDAVPQHHGNLAAVPQPADLGRVCGFDLRHGFADVLVRRSDPGFGNSARSRRQEAHENYLRHAFDGLARLATPLVLSVHSVISFDFSIAIVPGWHTTIFPPYFVAGAIYSGFAMVLTSAIPLRKAYGLEDFITMRHLENMAMVMLATGLIVAYGYFFEFFMSLYSGNKFDLYLTQMRFHGPYSHFYYALILCNILTPQLLWFHKARTNIPLLFVMSLVVNLGMWLERFVIVVISLTRDFMPSAWGRYSATVWDYAT